MEIGSKRFVYVLQSLKNSKRYYVGLTSNIERRLETHNKGGSTYTAIDRPWQINVLIEFQNENLATAFEKYLKSGSGRAFAKRHFA
jgi:putative endonuclease